MYKKVVTCHQYRVTRWYRADRCDAVIGGVAWGYPDSDGYNITLIEVIELPEIPDGSREDSVVISNGSVPLNDITKEVEVELPVPDGWIRLQDGSFLYKWYGKYSPGMLLISDTPEIKFEAVSPQDFNLPEGDLCILKGSYFKTKRGADAFRVDAEGNHILIRDSWGGAFNRYRGDTLPEDQALYYRVASSNGGGTGYDYAIFPRGWQYIVSIDGL
jgi:hypothetical protein